MEAAGDFTESSVSELGSGASLMPYSLSQKEWVAAVSTCLLVIIAAVILLSRETGGRRLEEKLSKEQEEVLHRLLEKKGAKEHKAGTNVKVCTIQYLLAHRRAACDRQYD